MEPKASESFNPLPQLTRRDIIAAFVLNTLLDGVVSPSSPTLPSDEDVNHLTAIATAWADALIEKLDQ